MIKPEDIKKVIVKDSEGDRVKRALERNIKPFVIVDPDEKSQEIADFVNAALNGTIVKPAQKPKEDLRKEYKLFETKVVNHWNAFVGRHPQLSAVVSMSDKRRAWLKNRFMKKHFRENIFKAIDGIAKSEFLLGKNKRKWKVSFDFMIKNDNSYLKVLEGAYLDDYPKKGMDKWIDDE